MISLEEYIIKRKKEDGVDESSLKNKDQNLQLCVNYVFEYFNAYVNISNIQKEAIENDTKLKRYMHSIEHKEEKVQEWLIKIYKKHNVQINRSIELFLKRDLFFYVENSESAFRKYSYNCYAKLSKKNKFLDEYTEELYLFIKDYYTTSSKNDLEFPFAEFNDKVNKYLEDTWNQYHVNIMRFCSDYADYVYATPESWPSYAKTRTLYNDYDLHIEKIKKNYFNFDMHYKRLEHLPYIKNKKNILLALIMYKWVTEIYGEDNTNPEFYENFIAEHSK